MANVIANVVTGVAILSFKYPGDAEEVPGEWAEVGYTEDGVNFEYSADTADIEVEEETVAIGRVITRETISVTCNIAESSLENMEQAIAGSVLAEDVITIGPAVGPGIIKEMSIKIEGDSPAVEGVVWDRTIYIPLATATGTVGMAYRKGEKTIVPVTFRAFKGVDAIGDPLPVCTITDSAPA